MSLVPRSEQVPDLPPIPKHLRTDEQWREWIKERLTIALFRPLQKLGWGGYELALTPPGGYQAMPGFAVTIFSPKTVAGILGRGRTESLGVMMPEAVAALLVEMATPAGKTREHIVLKVGEDPVPYVAAFLKQFVQERRLQLPAGVAQLVERTSLALPPAVS
jgi:hypothetical protein